MSSVSCFPANFKLSVKRSAVQTLLPDVSTVERNAALAAYIDDHLTEWEYIPAPVTPEGAYLGHFEVYRHFIIGVNDALHDGWHTLEIGLGEDLTRLTGPYNWARHKRLWTLGFAVGLITHARRCIDAFYSDFYRRRVLAAWALWWRDERLLVLPNNLPQMSDKKGKGYKIREAANELCTRGWAYKIGTNALGLTSEGQKMVMAMFPPHFATVTG